MRGCEMRCGSRGDRDARMGERGAGARGGRTAIPRASERDSADRESIERLSRGLRGATMASTMAFRCVVSTALRDDGRDSTRSARRGGVVRAGMFDFLQNNKDVGGRDTTFEAQQEILRKRRSGANLGKEVAARRAKVSRFVNKKLPEQEMRLIEKKNRDKANALSKEAIKGGIPLPMASFGMPEFDGGERFDLRGKYVDEGWVD